MQELPRRPIPQRPFPVKERVLEEVRTEIKNSQPQKKKDKAFLFMYLGGGFLLIAGFAVLILSFIF